VLGVLAAVVVLGVVVAGLEVLVAGLEVLLRGADAVEVVSPLPLSSRTRAKAMTAIATTAAVARSRGVADRRSALCFPTPPPCHADQATRGASPRRPTV
jgi:hypothetical protein